MLIALVKGKLINNIKFGGKEAQAGLSEGK